ncbi:MAG: aromatic ring-hydroxylating dioxygenase subunit alpha [Saprospiraceae bacterium]|jgi:choline monooxygenase|nr:aromatic ring-hydroxylating dioxygenase subunit alpha [Saprospiraceae bacterium]
MARFEIDPDISKAKTIHTDFYTSQDVFNDCKEKIFTQNPHYIGDTDRLPESACMYPVTLLPEYMDEPLIVIRDKDDTIRCLSNVCTHRGNLLVTQPCQAGQLRCRYHGRTFSLDGQMIFMPEFTEVKDFPCNEDNLVSLPVFQWGKLIFTSLNREVNPAHYFKDMMDRMSFFPMDQLIRRDDLGKDYIIAANWALYCENYLEGFHIPFIHQGLSSVLDYGDYETELYYPYSSLQLGVAKNSENTFDLPADSPDFGRHIAAFYFWIFPNMMFNFYPWGLSLNIVQPLSTDQTKVSFITYMYDESKYNHGAGSDLDKVEMEDEEIVQNVQKGIKSRFYSQGRYSVTRERGTHHFHRLLTEFINK